jgi:hypothetical protein
MQGRSLLVLGLTLLADAAKAELPQPLPQIDQIVVHKAARTMDLYIEALWRARPDGR